MAESPRLSICIPTFNMGEWLGAAVQSAITLGCPEEIEVVVVDNGSTDDTATVLANLAPYPHLRTLRPADHLPMAENWNRTVRACRGEWVTVLNADDELSPTYYDNLRNHLAREDTAILSQTARVAEGNRVVPFGPTAPTTYDVEAFVVTLGMAVCISTTAFRRTDFDAVDGFDPAVGSLLDFDLFVRIALETRRPVVALGADGGNYFPSRGATWMSVVDKGEDNEHLLRWITQRGADLGPGVVDAARRSLARKARSAACQRLLEHNEEAAARGLAVAAECTTGLPRDAYLGAAALMRAAPRAARSAVRAVMYLRHEWRRPSRRTSDAFNHSA